MEREFETVLVERCAATLAGVKAASLFRYIAGEGEEVLSQVQCWDRWLSPFGVRVLLIRRQAGSPSCLVYVYREKLIGQILLDRDVQCFLKQRGYALDSVKKGQEDVLEQLAVRLWHGGGFPHEIGVFLGYPLEDVVGFIRNNGRNFTYSGFWKAYGDPEAAKKRFAQYEKCAKIYRQLHQGGKSILKMTVAA